MYKEEQSNIGNCPHCTKIIFKDAVFNSEASFSTRCPHCSKAVRVLVKHKVEVTLIAVQDERTKKISSGPGLVVLILVLYLPPIIHRVVDNMDNILILT
jgi:DNA-directed RNA polymerase subunit RPC12/RpoP